MHVNPEKFFLAMSGNYGEMAALLESLPPIEEADWVKVLRAWDKGGLLGLGSEQGEYRSWANVCAHQMVVARVGYAVARALERHLAEEEFTPYDMLLALLVHDSDKPAETYWLDEEVTADRPITFEWYERRIFAGKAELQAIGFSEMVAWNAGLTSEYGMDLIRKGQATLAQMIGFYADMTVTGTTAMSFNERLDRLQVNFRRGGNYEKWKHYYRIRYGIDDHKTLWSAAGRIVAAEFCKYLGDHDFLDTPFEQLTFS